MFSYHIQDLTSALEQLESLRNSLDYIRATTVRSGLAETVRDFQGKASALREELEDSIAAHSGNLLTLIAEEVEAAEIARGEGDEGLVCTLGELRRQGENKEPIALDRDLRVLHKTWEESRTSEDLEIRLSEAKFASEFGLQAAAVLTKYHEDIKKRAESNRFA